MCFVFRDFISCFQAEDTTKQCYTTRPHAQACKAMQTGLILVLILHAKPAERLTHAHGRTDPHTVTAAAGAIERQARQEHARND